MSKVTNKQSKEPSTLAQVGLFSVVAIVAGVGIWSQLKSEDTPKSQQAPQPVAVAASSAVPPPEPTAMAAVPAVDYTAYTEAPAASKPIAKQEPKPEPKKESNTSAKQADVKVEPKKAKEKEEVAKKSEPSPAKQAPAAASAPSAEKPKSSDFAYTQPIVNSNKPNAPSSASANAVSSLESAKTITIPKVQAFDPVALESAGDKAWVKISPSSTVIIKKGQELPNYGKLKEISNNQLVFEKGSIPFEKTK